MARIERNFGTDEYLQAAGADGLGLVRKIIRYNQVVQGITYGLFNDEQRLAAGDLAEGVGRFWRNYYPAFVQFEGKLPIQSQIDFLTDEAERRTERDFSWTHSETAAADWRQWYEENFTGICHRQATDLLDILELPQAVLDLDAYATDWQIIQTVGAPEKTPGLRFLPGYRCLEWQTRGSAESFKLVFGERWQDGKIWLENPEGRRFFIASTSGALGIEELLRGLRSQQINISISEAVFANDLPAVEFALFDIDRTLQIYRSGGWMGSYEDVTTMQMIKDRTKCLKNLAARGIKIGLWSRNSQETVEGFASRLQKETGVNIYSCISLDNWPFLITKETPGDRYVFEVLGEAEIKRRVSQSAEKMGLTIDSKNWARRIRDLLAEVNMRAKRPFVLEAKAPCLAALWLGKDNPQIARAMWDGVIVNDAAETLKSALVLGFSFVHVDHISTLSKAAKAIL